MKKTILMAMLIFFVSSLAQAEPIKMFDKMQPLTAYLDKTDSGNTTAASGTSVCVLQGLGKKRSTGGKYFDANEYGPWYGVQLIDLDSSQAQQGLGGTISKDFDFFAECSLDETDWANAQRFYFYKDETATATTNNTAGPKWARLPANTHIRFGFVTGSGATVFDHAEFRIYPGKEGDFYTSPPISLLHISADFGTTGLTTFVSGLTTVPSGCNCIEIQFTGTDGGYSSPATSGVSKIVEENDVLPMPVTEYNEGSYGPGAAAAGTINAQYWTECPK